MADSAGPILLVLLLFCCCVSSVGGGIFWYTTTQTSNAVAAAATAPAAPAPAPVADSTIATASNVANPSGLNFYKGSGLSFMKYTNIANDPECAIGWNYYEKDKKKLILGNIPNITNKDDTQEWCARATPLPSVITTYSAAVCQQSGALFIDDKLTCNDGGTQAGITWKWAVDNQSHACQQNCGGYIVTVVSAALADIILKRTITDPAQSGAGISSMAPPWYQGALTFTVMPVDKKGKNLLQVPVSKNVNIMQDQARCKQVGVFTTEPVPHWNDNKNLIGVRMINTGGNFGGWGLNSKDNVLSYTPGDSVLASAELSFWVAWNTFGAIKSPNTAFVYVPKKGGITILCDGHTSIYQSWNNDNTWDVMMAKGAANKEYTYTIEFTCWSGDAKDDYSYYAGWGDNTPKPRKIVWATPDPPKKK